MCKFREPVIPALFFISALDLSARLSVSVVNLFPPATLMSFWN
jgi:hypothetical protein